MRFGRRRRREAQPFPVYAPGETRPAPAPSGHVRAVPASPTELSTAVRLDVGTCCTKVMVAVDGRIQEAPFVEPFRVETPGWYLLRYDPFGTEPPSMEGPVDLGVAYRAMAAQAARLSAATALVVNRR